MALMKAEAFERSKEKRQIFNLSDIAEEAREIIARAQREGQRILEQAQGELQRRYEQAKEEGYRDGHEKGLKEGREAGRQEALAAAREEFRRESEKTLQGLNQVLSRFEEEKGKILWLAEQHTVELALAIAEKIVKKMAGVRTEIALANVQEALKLVAGHTDVTIRVNPEDWKSLEQLAGEVLQGYERIRFQPDEGLARGDCVVETRGGEIDASLDTQLERIAEALLTKPPAAEVESMSPAG